MYKVTFINFQETDNIESFNETQDEPPIPTEFVNDYGTMRGSIADMEAGTNQIIRATYYYNGGVIIVERMEE